MPAIPVAAPAVSPPPLVRQYRDLALSPAGDQVAAVEYSATGEEAKEPRRTVVIRRASDGGIVQ
ncbi:MAG: hypothetical protein ACR2F8_14310 [Caulobacteraceae bacterium]